jgi:pSer/pThr/pTyr-binding forkhead associated (FHA) protein
VTEDQPLQGKLLSMSRLLESFLALSQEEFLEAHPYPMVVTDNPGEVVENAHFHTIAAVPDSSSGTDHARLLERMGKWAFQLKKKGRFASMLTVGRAANSDLRLNVPSVSKFHAYFIFVARDKAWYVSDAKSSNGTFVGGKEIPPTHGKVKLESGVTLRFGPDVTCQFLTPQGLWAMFSGRITDTPPEGTPIGAVGNADDTPVQGLPTLTPGGDPQADTPVKGSPITEGGEQPAEVSATEVSKTADAEDGSGS